MAKTIQPPANVNVQIASLDQKKYQWDTVDPMRAGEGTPWEDRGTLGPVKAHFRTAVAAMRTPGQLFAEIRRPHGRKDAIWYAVIAALPWGASWVMHSWLKLWWFAASHPEKIANINYDNCTYASILQFLAAPLLTWPLLLIAVAVLHKLVVGETHAKFSPSLTTNVVAYALGPGLASLVPVIGPPVAAVWTMAAMIIGCKVRLRLGTFGALVCTVLAVLAAAVVGILVYLLGWWVWTSSYPAYDSPPPPQIHSGYR